MMLEGREAPEAIAATLGLQQIADASSLQTVVDRVLAEQPKSVEDYLTGKTTALQFLVGQCMRLTKGQAHPQRLTALLQDRLETLRGTHS